MALKGGVWGCVGSRWVGHGDEVVSLEAVREWLRGCCVDIDAAGAVPRLAEEAVEGVSVSVSVSQLLSSDLNVVVVVKNELVSALTAGVVVAAVVVIVVPAGSIGALVVMVLVNTCCFSFVLHDSAMHHPPPHTPPHVRGNHYHPPPSSPHPTSVPSSHATHHLSHIPNRDQAPSHSYSHLQYHL